MMRSGGTPIDSTASISAGDAQSKPVPAPPFAASQLFVTLLDCLLKCCKQYRSASCSLHAVRDVDATAVIGKICVITYYYMPHCVCCHMSDSSRRLGA